MMIMIIPSIRNGKFMFVGNIVIIMIIMMIMIIMIITSNIRDGKFMFVRNELRQLHEGSQQTGDTIDWNGEGHADEDDDGYDDGYDGDGDDDSDCDDVENTEFSRQWYNPEAWVPIPSHPTPPGLYHHTR